MFKSFHILLFAILLALVAFAPCGAAELVTNGGFETGDFTGWTVTPASSGSLVGVGSLVSSIPATPHSGTYAAYFGATGSFDDTISQTLSTVPGQSYTFSFWLDHAFGRSTSDFTASWNGLPLLSLTNSLLFPYTLYSFTEIAGPLPTIIAFSGLENPAYFYLDDVSVQGPQAVPIPPSLLLLGSGLVGMGVIGRRTRRKTLIFG